MGLGTNLYFNFINTQMELLKWFLNSSILITKGNNMAVAGTEEKRVAKENKKVYRDIVKQCLTENRTTYNGETRNSADKEVINILASALATMRQQLLSVIQVEMEEFKQNWTERGPDVIGDFIRHDPTSPPDLTNYNGNVKIANSFFIYPKTEGPFIYSASFMPSDFYEDIPLGLIDNFDLYITVIYGNDPMSTNRIAIMLSDNMKHQLFASCNSAYVEFHKYIYSGVVSAFKAKGITPIVDGRRIQ